MNAMAFAPVSKSTIEAWADLGNDGWDWASFSKSLARSRTVESTDGSGPIQLSFPACDSQGQIKQLWHDTIGNLGYGKHLDGVAGDQLGAMTIPDTIIPGSRTRSYAANAYLLPAAASRSNLTIQTNAMVHKILLEPSTTGDDDAVATGVLFYDADGNVKTVYAKKEIVVSAGTVNSPKILELSGIGKAEHLSSLGIKVIIDNPYVGENFQNHCMADLSVEVDPSIDTLDNLSRKDAAALALATEQYQKQTGPFSKSVINEIALLPLSPSDREAVKEFISSSANKYVASGVHGDFAKAHAEYVYSVVTSPDHASAVYFVAPAFVSYLSNGNRAPPPQGTEKYLSILLLLSHPLSKGSIHITSSNPEVHPKLNQGVLTHPFDAEVLARHVIYSEKTILATDPLASIIRPGGKRRPIKILDNLDTVKKYLSESANGAHHLGGTCSMLPKKLGGVVDSKLKVYGTSNLRVCDSSIMPILPRGNTQSAVYGIAEHGAAIIMSDA